MTISDGLYGATFRDCLDTSALGADLLTDTMKSALMTDTYAPNFDTHSAFTDLTNECTGTGYTTLGSAISSLAWNTTLNSGYLSFDGATAAWTTATIADIEGRAVVDDTLTNNNMFALTDFGSTYSVTAGTFTITEHADGIFRVSL